MTRPATPRVPWMLLVIVVAALAVGAAASILVGASIAPSPSSGPASLVFLPDWILVLASGGFILFVVGILVVSRLRSGPTLSRNPLAAIALSTILAMFVLLFVFNYLHIPPLGTGGSGTTTPGGNGTPPPPPPAGGNNVTGPGGVITWLGVPPWLPFVVLAAVVLLAVVAAPRLHRYIGDRRAGSATRAASSDAKGVREALSRASTDLGLGGDPRVVILNLYAALLQRLTPLVRKLDASTPEEIRAAHLERLGVRSGPARTLTRLFEEARYSSHPMGPEASRRAQEAVRAVLDDLDRRESPS